LLALYAKAAEVFISADLLWYPVEGEPGVYVAPSVLVVFGRPKGEGGSCLHWEGGNMPATVAFDILCPSNSIMEMSDKHDFYDHYGVDEYYVYDPDNNDLMIYLRQETALRLVQPVGEFVSPRLGIRFLMTEPEMTVYGPDGQSFHTFEQVEQALQFAERRAAAAEKQAADALAEVERLRQLLSEAKKPHNPE
jgi:hypothetical protein